MHIPPPALALASVVAQRVVARNRPITPIRGVLAAGIAAGSAAFPMTALKQLERVGTTVDPTHPERTTSLVTSGPYSVTRNPMYLGLTGFLIANAVRKGSVTSLLPVVAFVAVVDRVQIASEEDALSDRFGAEYDAYRIAVPRWLDARSLDLGGL